MRDGLKDAHRDAIIAAIAANDRVERAVLFGSRATGTNTASSDVDIALFGDRLTLTDQARLAAALDEIPMAQSVDLLLYDSIRTRNLREHIRDCGVEWYIRPKAPGIAMAAERLRIEPKHVAWARTRHRQLDNHWKEVPLGTLVDIFDGPHATPRKTQAGPIFLGISNLSSGRLDFEKTEHLSEADYVRWTRRVTPQPNDIVFSYETRLGEAALIPEGLRACLGRRMGLLRPKAGAIDARYLLYAFLGQEFQNTLRFRTVHGSTVDRIPLTEMVEFPISIPREISEQRAIARVLGTLDDKIELNQRMNKTLEAMARALFKSWFVDFEPVRAKIEGRDTGLPTEVADLFPDRFSESEVGETPEGWKISVIGDEVDAVGGATPSTKEPAYWENGTYYWATPKDLSALSSTVLLETDRKISGAGIDKISSGLLPTGTVLLSSRAPVGYLAIAEIPTAINQGFIAMVCNRRLPNVYVLFWCHENLDYIKSIAGGSTFSEISKKVFRPLPVIVPSERVLLAYEDFVCPLYDRIVANTKECVSLVQARDLLLPRLISGEIFVKQFDRAEGACADATQLLLSGCAGVPSARCHHAANVAAGDDGGLLERG